MSIRLWRFNLYEFPQPKDYWCLSFSFQNLPISGEPTRLTANGDELVSGRGMRKSEPSLSQGSTIFGSQVRSFQPAPAPTLALNLKALVFLELHQAASTWNCEHLTNYNKLVPWWPFPVLYGSSSLMSNWLQMFEARSQNILKSSSLPEHSSATKHSSPTKHLSRGEQQHFQPQIGSEFAMDVGARVTMPLYLFTHWWAAIVGNTCRLYG